MCAFVQLQKPLNTHNEEHGDGTSEAFLHGRAVLASIPTWSLARAGAHAFPPSSEWVETARFDDGIDVALSWSELVWANQSALAWASNFASISLLSSLRTHVKLGLIMHVTASLHLLAVRPCAQRVS